MEKTKKQFNKKILDIIFKILNSLTIRVEGLEPSIFHIKNGCLTNLAIL